MAIKVTYNGKVKRTIVKKTVIRRPPPTHQNGWSPIFTIEVTIDLRRVFKILDWFGGSGTKPASNVYLTDNGGYSTDVNDGVDIGAGVPGTDGVDGVDGTDGVDGVDGTDGTDGTDGQGVPVGGTAGQVLSKIDGTDYNTQWVAASGGSGTFAGLTDLSSNLVSGAYDLTSDTQAKITATDGTYLSYFLTDLGFMEMFQQDGAGSNFNFYAIADGANPNGFITMDYSGSLRKFGVDFGFESNIPIWRMHHSLWMTKISYTIAGTTELDYGRMLHDFSGTTPSGSVKINKAKSGDWFVIKNTTGSSITFIQSFTETFNGAASVVIPTGQSATFQQFAADGIFVVSIGINTGDQTNISGNAATVTTNANLTGPITSVGNATSVASQTGTGSTFVMNASPTLVTPNLGTPSTLVGTNITGTASGLTAGNVTTNANMTGEVTSVGNAQTIAANAVTNAKLAQMATLTLKGNNTGGSSDPLDLTATQTKALLAIANTDVSGLGTLATQSGTFSGTSSGTNTGDQANISGNAATVTTNANLTGPVTSIGNATTVTPNSITNAMQSQMAANTLKGNNTGGAADPINLTVAQVQTMLGTTGGGLGSSMYVGDGSDGSVVISGNVLLNTDMYYDDLTVNNGFTLTTAGYKVHVKGTLTNNGTILGFFQNANPNNGAINTGGNGAAIQYSGTTFDSQNGSKGGNGGLANGSQGSSQNQSTYYYLGGAGGDGGKGGDGSGGTGGASRTTVIGQGLLKIAKILTSFGGLQEAQASGVEGRYPHAGGAGASGSGGGGDGVVAGRGGGGSSSGGGMVALYCDTLDNTNGTISAPGKAGANGAVGSSGNVGGGGGAGGSGGGFIYIFAQNIISIGTFNLAGGAGGLGGAGFGTGTAGSNGNDGSLGKYVYINGSTGVITTNY